MKKIFITTITCLAVSTALAQIPEGSYFLASTNGLSNGKTTDKLKTGSTFLTDDPFKLSGFIPKSEASAQIPKGSFFLGSTLGFSNGKSTDESKSGSTTTTEDPTTSSSYSVMPSLEYFFANNLSAGITFGIAGFTSERSSTSGNIKSTSTDKFSGIGWGIGLRKYWDCSDNFKTFAGFGINSGSLNGSSTDKTTNTNTNISIESVSKGEMKTMDIGLLAGFAWLATNRILVSGSFGVLKWNKTVDKYDILDNGDYEQTTDTGINFLVSSGMPIFNMGFAYRLNK